ncbi:formate/nitrite transporter family protein [Macrococcus sp. EM39E]|uniref:formate/nitrite transporter family protein n=1 Tax=Macrococcus animalis TaxID=3395467 RepID=UPI0039BE7EBC
MTNKEQIPQSTFNFPETEKFFYGRKLMDGIQDTVMTKESLVKDFFIRYILRAVMAGFIIALMTVFTWKARIDFAPVIGADLANLVGGITFSFALIFIIFTYSELLTSNFMYFTVGVFYRSVTIRRALLVFTLCFLGNLIGGVLLFSLLKFSTVISSDMLALMHTTVEKKTSLSSLDIFIRGIFANFFINISIIVTMHFKEALPKMVAMIIGVTIFAYMGYEHVIANGVIYICSLIYQFDASHIVPMIRNLFFSGLGNYVGGGLFIGLFYAYLNDPKRH